MKKYINKKAKISTHEITYWHMWSHNHIWGYSLTHYEIYTCDHILNNNNKTHENTRPQTQYVNTRRSHLCTCDYTHEAKLK